MITLVDPRGLYRSGHPLNLAELKALGIKTVINLETGINDLIHFDLFDEDISAEDLQIDVLHEPLSDLSAPTTARTEDILALIQTKLALGGVLICCLHGKDRTGWVCAAWKVIKMKVSEIVAFKDMYDMGFHRIFYFWWPMRLTRVLHEIQFP